VYVKFVYFRLKFRKQKESPIHPPLGPSILTEVKASYKPRVLSMASAID
jgi:hypothetical protein